MEHKDALTLSEAICFLAVEIGHLRHQREIEFEVQKSHLGLATKHDLKELENKLMAANQDILDALAKIDTATNKIADNVAAIAVVDQTISDEIDKFLAGVPAGTVITPEQIAQLQALADKAQASSDASDAQVAVLQAIAAKGAGNPVPLAPPTT